MERFTAAELALKTGVSVRTLRYWMAEGILPGPIGMGPGAHFDAGHVERIERIKVWKNEGKSLARIKIDFQLEAMSADPNFVVVHPALSDPERILRFSRKGEVEVSLNENLPVRRKRALLEALDRFFKMIEPVE